MSGLCQNRFHSLLLVELVWSVADSPRHFLIACAISSGGQGLDKKMTPDWEADSRCCSKSVE